MLLSVRRENRALKRCLGETLLYVNAYPDSVQKFMLGNRIYPCLHIYLRLIFNDYNPWE